MIQGCACMCLCVCVSPLLTITDDLNRYILLQQIQSARHTDSCQTTREEKRRKKQRQYIFLKQCWSSLTLPCVSFVGDSFDCSSSPWPWLTQRRSRRSSKAHLLPPRREGLETRCHPTEWEAKSETRDRDKRQKWKKWEKREMSEERGRDNVGAQPWWEDSHCWFAPMTGECRWCMTASMGPQREECLHVATHRSTWMSNNKQYHAKLKKN